MAKLPRYLYICTVVAFVGLVWLLVLRNLVQSISLNQQVNYLHNAHHNLQVMYDLDKAAHPEGELWVYSQRDLLSSDPPSPYFVVTQKNGVSFVQLLNGDGVPKIEMQAGPNGGYINVVQY